MSEQRNQNPHQIWATTVAVNGTGVILRGPSGAGKTDLAIRLIDRGAILVSDDQTIVRADGDFLLTAPPATIAGKIEVRSIGIMRMNFVTDIPAAVIFDLETEGERERLPDFRYDHIEGVKLPLFCINAFEESAAVKVFLTLDALQRNLFDEGGMPV